MSIIDDITKGLQTGNTLAPLVIGLIAMLRKTGDTRSDDEILMEAATTAAETAQITKDDM